MENSRKKIFIGGLPANITEAQLKEHFAQYGTVSRSVLLPARRYASAGLCDSDVSVCLDVWMSGRLSVTRRYCA